MNNMNSFESLPFFPIGGKKVPSFCSYCRRDTTQQCRIKCADCQNIFLCTDCFCSGVEFNTHKPTHPYQINDSLDFPLFFDDWTVAEELLMLEGDQHFLILKLLYH
jgi:transcriptional adapter 2-alpha